MATVVLCISPAIKTVMENTASAVAAIYTIDQVRITMEKEKENARLVDHCGGGGFVGIARQRDVSPITGRHEGKVLLTGG
jgi:hypothetical protein